MKDLSASWRGIAAMTVEVIQSPIIGSTEEAPMTEIIHAVYEQGVLRPLTPLHLPEHTHVQISIDLISNAEEERQRVRQALIAGGIIRPHLPSPSIQSVSEEALAVAAQALANAGSLSELIIAERDGR